MTFEEEFPSLKGKGMAIELHIHKPEDGTCKTNHFHWDRTKSNPSIIAASVIKKCCLDKQRVKETINYLIENYKEMRRKSYAGDVLRDFYQREIALIELKYKLGIK